MNIAAGSFIFRQDYDAALAESKLGQGAIQAALSAYNTGNFASGLTNGYVARYDTSGGIDALAARPAAWMHPPILAGGRMSIRLRRADFSVSPLAAVSLWGMKHLAPAARIALRDYLYPRAVFK
jgi:hypothetical protein